MGKGKRERPARLGTKLTEIRKKLGLSQNEMLHRLGLNDKLTREELSAYERGVREPTLLTLLKYGESAGVYVDVLIDDESDLPEKLPAKSRAEDTNIATLKKSRSKKSKLA